MSTVTRNSALRSSWSATVCGITPDDRLVAAFAPFALYGPALGIGAAVPRMDVTRPGTLTAIALAEAAAAVGGTLVFASPAALRNVVATASQLTASQRVPLQRIRLVLSAGAPVGVPLLRDLQRLLPAAEIHTPYGMTEVLPVTDIALPELEQAGLGNGVCVGHVLPGIRLGISRLDALGRAPGAPLHNIDVTGEICVSAGHVKDRYDRLWATEQASSRDPGWHRTGDVGHLDAAGRLWVEGRLAHVITAADGPITPVGAEQRIEARAPVTGAALVGVGPQGTQQPVAVVMTAAPARAGLADEDLARAVRAAAELPLAAVLTVRSLPVDIRHASKIDRSRLARWAGRNTLRRPGGPSVKDSSVRVLVTGTTGMLGRGVALALAARGDGVTVLQRRPANLGLPEVLTDVSDADAVRAAVTGHDAVIHLAAKVNVVGPEDEYLRINVRGTRAVVDACLAAGVERLVHVSSPSVAHPGRSLVGRGADPADPLTARGPYARSKAHAERVALGADGRELAVLAIRPHLVWGPGDTQLIARVVERARRGRLPLVGSGAALIDTTYVATRWMRCSRLWITA